ncbi:MAG: RNA polymerase sigma factor [Candidatus Krumholzibacteria bacterium]|nr:RNA polymerase sigma factor [Candidatus Krumholzibacteria bacterium]
MGFSKGIVDECPVMVTPNFDGCNVTGPVASATTRVSDAKIGQEMTQAIIIHAMRGNAENETDQEVIDRILGGDVDAFECLMDRYGEHVARIAGRRVPWEDSAEVVQDIFIRAYTSLSAYAGKGDFKWWLSKIAVRACCDFWRQRYKRREKPVSALNEDQARWLARATFEQSTRAHAEGAASREARELLAWALGRLSSEDRAVLELVSIEERPVAEAAELLGWSVVNVKVRAYRSRKKLRAILEKLMAKEDENDET